MVYRSDWGEIYDPWHNGRGIYYLLEDGRLGVNYNFSWYWTGSGYIGFDKDVLIPLQNVEDVVFTTSLDYETFFGENGDQEFYLGQKVSNYFIVRLIDGSFKKVKWTLDSAKYAYPSSECMSFQVQNLSQEEKNILDTAYSIDNVIFCMDSNSLIYGVPTVSGYCRLYEITFIDGVIQVWEIPQNNYYGARYVTMEISSGWPAMAGWSGKRKVESTGKYYQEYMIYEYKLLPNIRYRVVRNDIFCQPIEVYGIDYDVLRLNTSCRTGAQNYAIFLNSTWDKREGYGIVNTLNTEFITWLNNNNFKVYISARDEQMTAYNNGYMTDGVQKPKTERQTVNLSDLLTSTDFCGTYDYNNLQAILTDIKNKNPATLEHVPSSVEFEIA